MGKSYVVQLYNVFKAMREWRRRHQGRIPSPCTEAIASDQIQYINSSSYSASCLPRDKQPQAYSGA